MKGRAKQLFDDFRRTYPGPAGRFLMARMILMARVMPEELSTSLDDPDLEARLEKAIALVQDAGKVPRPETP